MAVYSNSKQTENGRFLENRARNGEGALEFTCIKTGSGIYTDDERQMINKATGMKEQRQVFSFSGITLEEEKDYLSLESVINNNNLKEGYFFSELGIFARMAGTTEKEVLYCIGVVDQPDYIPPQTNGKYEIILNSLIKCYDAENVSIQYNEKTYATAEALAHHILNCENPHKITKEQIGLENVDNTGDLDKPVSDAQQAAIDAVCQQASDYTNQIASETNTALNTHISNESNPHKVTKAQVGLGNVNNTSDVGKPVSTAQQAAIDAAYQQATAYADRIVNALVNGAPNTLDTLGEITAAMKDNQDVVQALEQAIGAKASEADFNGHAGNNTIHITQTERTNWGDANSKKHTHDNKSVLDAITSAIVTNWNNAVTHISDAVKHITVAERKKWNNGSANYGSCSTAAATAAKTVACTGFELTTGAEITVKFTATNTAANPTLNVNGTGAKAIYYRGSAVAASHLAANHTYTFRYNGTQWDLVGDLDTNTTYTNMTAATANAAGKAGLVPAPTAGAQAKYLRGDGTWQTPPDTNTTYTNMTAATTNAAGKAGLVPAPAAGDQAKYLRGDGAWVNPTGGINITHYTGVTTMTQLMTGLTAPCICLTSTECITDKPAGKYGSIVIFKYSDSRISALCICTDGTVYHNAWNASASTVTGWK